jgi:hypothetical protein
MEMQMAYITGDVIPNPGGEGPFKVVFKQGQTIIAEWSVESQKEGEEDMVSFIKEAFENDDDEEDKDDGK